MFEIALGLQIREQKPFQVLAQNMNGGMEFLFFAIKSQLTYGDPVRLSRLESGFELRFPRSFSDTLNNILCWWNSLLGSEFFTGMFIYTKLNNINFYCLSFFSGPYYLLYCLVIIENSFVVLRKGPWCGYPWLGWSCHITWLWHLWEEIFKFVFHSANFCVETFNASY